MNPISHDAEQKDLTITLCVYNEERFLRALLDSILMQRDVRYDLIIVNDGSCDATADVIAEYQDKFPDGCTIYHSAHQGLRPNRKMATESCVTRYVMTLDADCRLVEANCLHDMLAGFTSEDIFAIQGHILSYRDDPTMYSVATTFSDELFYQSIVVNQTDVKTLLGGGVIYDHAKLMSLGGLTSGNVGEDTDIARKAAKNGWKMKNSSAIIQHRGIPSDHGEYVRSNLRKGNRSAYNFRGHYKQMLSSLSALKFVPLLSSAATAFFIFLSLLLSSRTCVTLSVLAAAPLIMILCGGYNSLNKMSLPDKQKGFFSPFFIIYENILWAIGFISETVKMGGMVGSLNDDRRF